MWSFIKNYPRKYWHYYSVGLVLLVITNIVTTQIPMQIQAILDTLLSNSSQADIQKMIVILVALAATLALSRALSRISFFVPGRLVERDIRSDVYQKLMHQPDMFFQKHTKGDLMSRIINDIQNLRLGAALGLLHIVNTTMMYSFVLYRMLHIDVALSLAIVIPVPIVMFLVRGLVSKLYILTRESQSILGKVTQNIVNGFQSIAMIKAYHIQEPIEAHVHANTQRLKDINVSLARVRSLMFPAIASLASFGHVILFSLGSFALLENRLTIGEFVAMSSFITLLAWPTASLAWIISILQRGRASWERLSDILEAPVLKSILQNKHISPTSLELKNVQLKLGKTGLNNISFQIKAGESLGIFGPTGSGKSLLVQVLTGQTPHSTGQLLLDKQDISHTSCIERSNWISVVSQRPFLFSETVDRNIAYAKELEIRNSQESAKLAAVDEDIQDFIKQYETMIGEKGILLSGGQKLRLTLARAFHRSSSILILDDPLASVDADTQDNIITHLFSLKNRPTLILSSHRISALKQCDSIIILEKGCITYQGNHETLLKTCKYYQKSWAYQQHVEDHL